jgi:hypothetical protein
MRIGGVVRLDNGVVVNIAIKLLSCTMVCGLFHVILMDRPLVKAVSSFYITVFDIWCEPSVQRGINWSYISASIISSNNSGFDYNIIV